MDSITTPIVLLNLFAVGIAAAVLYGSENAQPWTLVAGTSWSNRGPAPPAAPATVNGQATGRTGGGKGGVTKSSP
jgi:hypothetical protein